MIKMIGIRQFSKNLSKLLKEAEENEVHFIVMRHGEPVVQIAPVRSDDDWDGIDLDELRSEVQKSRKEAECGETQTIEEVADDLGIHL